MCFSLVRLLAESIDDSPLLLKAAIADYKEKQNVTVWDAVARFHKGCAESKQYVQYGNHTETTVSQFRCGGERHPKKKYKLNSLAQIFESRSVSCLKWVWFCLIDMPSTWSRSHRPSMCEPRDEITVKISQFRENQGATHSKSHDI